MPLMVDKKNKTIDVHVRRAIGVVDTLKYPRNWLSALFFMSYSIPSIQTINELKELRRSLNWKGL